MQKDLFSKELFLRKTSGKTVFLPDSQGSFPSELVVPSGHTSWFLFDDTGSKGSLTQIRVEKNASLCLIRLQLTSDQSIIRTNTCILQEESSQVKILNITLGSGEVENQLQILLSGRNAQCQTSGILVFGGKGHCLQKVQMEHKVSDCQSNQLFKVVVGNDAVSEFEGLIRVSQDAQKTQAFQRSDALLQSANARAKSMPFLEIYADDVKCSHGATVGQLDKEALFYMQSRGIGREEARRMLISAFANEPLEIIPEAILRQQVEEWAADVLLKL